MLIGGINDDNACRYLTAGASHVIVTSYVFTEGEINIERLKHLVAVVGGKQKLVLDLSCRKRESSGDYYVVTNKWTKFTNFTVK